MPLSIAATVGTTRTTTTQISAVKVVDKVDNEYLHSAKALKNGAEQLIDMLFVMKQQIQLLRNTNQLAIDAHKAAAKSLELPKTLDGVPLIPRDGECGEDITPNPLFAENGLDILIDKLSSAELATAKCFEKFANPKTVLATYIVILNSQQQEIKATLLSNKRLGKAHQRSEQKLTDKAREVNDFISLLRKSCLNHGTVIHPLWDPYVLHARTEYKMKDFLQTEFEYEKYCLKEVLSIGEMDEKVFSLLEVFPVEMEKVMTPLRKECIKVWETVGRVEKSDPLVEWNAFMERFGGRFVPENVEPMGKEFPGDEEYKKFERICQYDLEIYHKVEKETFLSDETSALKSKNILDAIKRAVTLPEHKYTVRGVWYVSERGNLIEFDHKECKALSIFDLGKCRLGILAPDELERYGYFVLEGIKREGPSDNKSTWMRRKVYKFRNKLEKAKEMHKVLAEFCKCDILTKGMQGGEVQRTSEEAFHSIPAATQGPLHTMDGTTLVNTEDTAPSTAENTDVQRPAATEDAVDTMIRSALVDTEDTPPSTTEETVTQTVVPTEDAVDSMAGTTLVNTERSAS